MFELCVIEYWKKINLLVKKIIVLCIKIVIFFVNFCVMVV